MSENDIPVVNLLQDSGQFRVVVVLEVDLSASRGRQEEEGPQVDHGPTWGPLKCSRFLASSQK